MTGNNDFNNTENDSTNSRTEKLWKIIGEEYISYTGGTAFVISNGECKVKLWERLEEAQLFCDKLNEQHETIQSLKEQLSEAKADEKQLGISFMGFKMKLIEVLQKKYDKAKGKTLYADVYIEIAEEMGVDLE